MTLRFIPDLSLLIDCMLIFEILFSGQNSGVIALSKKKQPAATGVHCFAHRLELAFKDALKMTPLFDRIYRLLLKIFLFYHYSALHRSNLAKACETFNVTKKVPARVGGTRWLHHTEREGFI